MLFAAGHVDRVLVFEQQVDIINVPLFHGQKDGTHRYIRHTILRNAQYDVVALRNSPEGALDDLMQRGDVELRMSREEMEKESVEARVLVGFVHLLEPVFPGAGSHAVDIGTVVEARHRHQRIILFILDRDR